MSRRAQQLVVVADAAELAGASVWIEQRQSGHYCATLTINGRSGKIFFGGSPSDRNAFKNARRAVERKLHELRDTKQVRP